MESILIAHCSVWTFFHILLINKMNEFLCLKWQVGSSKIEAEQQVNNSDATPSEPPLPNTIQNDYSLQLSSSQHQGIPFWLFGSSPNSQRTQCVSSNPVPDLELSLAAPRPSDQTTSSSSPRLIRPIGVIWHLKGILLELPFVVTWSPSQRTCFCNGIINSTASIFVSTNVSMYVFFSNSSGANHLMIS